MNRLNLEKTKARLDELEKEAESLRQLLITDRPKEGDIWKTPDNTVCKMYHAGEFIVVCLNFQSAKRSVERLHPHDIFVCNIFDLIQESFLTYSELEWKMKTFPCAISGKSSISNENHVWLFRTLSAETRKNGVERIMSHFFPNTTK